MKNQLYLLISNETPDLRKNHDDYPNVCAIYERVRSLQHFQGKFVVGAVLRGTI
jgi:hypothetical protein